MAGKSQEAFQWKAEKRFQHCGSVNFTWYLLIKSHWFSFFNIFLERTNGTESHISDQHEGWINLSKRLVFNRGMRWGNNNLADYRKISGRKTWRKNDAFKWAAWFCLVVLCSIEPMLFQPSLSFQCRDPQCWSSNPDSVWNYLEPGNQPEYRQKKLESE